MTTFLFIRHALCDPVGHAIAGRAPGVHLNQAGRAQARALAKRLAYIPLTAVYSSPLERALETAESIALPHGLAVRTALGLNEIDFGVWTGRTLAELQGIPEWRQFNASRSNTRIPGGETMAEVLGRGLFELERVWSMHPDNREVVALVSHGDVLRAVLTRVMGSRIDLLDRVEVSPASVSVVTYGDLGQQVLLLNSTEGSLDAVAPSWVG
jgi:broad specificity phosphatase PhoE